jgi:pilus assembly protein Flp/PilA
MNMRLFVKTVAQFIRREDGPTAVEYAVMLALIVVVCITTIIALGSNSNRTFTKASTSAGGSGS